MWAIRIIIVIVGFLAVVYSRSLFYALDDELDDDLIDCFITAFLLLAGYGLLYIIYWSMRSVMPRTLTPILYLGLYFIFLSLAYWIKAFTAIQWEWNDGRIHIQHKDIVELKRERKRKRKENVQKRKRNRKRV